MLIVVYDIQSDRLRTKVSKFLQKYGRRIQYSVFEIQNSRRTVDNIKSEMTTNFEKKFTQGDSVLVFDVGDNSNILRFGYPKGEETDLLIWE